MMAVRIMPNQNRAFQAPAQAWAWAMGVIAAHGDPIVTEDMQLTREVMNLQVTVLEPCNPDNWPIEGSGWSLPALEVYAQTEILSPVVPDGFPYSYGGQLFDYDCNDQIAYVIEKLKENANTRRAIAITWMPMLHQLLDNVPCLQSVDFLFRAGKLHLTAYFRSWDVARAAPANMYGLAKLLEYVAHQVSMPTGSLTVMAASAHIYER